MEICMKLSPRVPEELMYSREAERYTGQTRYCTTVRVLNGVDGLHNYTYMYVVLHGCFDVYTATHL